MLSSQSRQQNESRPKRSVQLLNRQNTQATKRRLSRRYVFLVILLDQCLSPDRSFSTTHMEIHRVRWVGSARKSIFGRIIRRSVRQYTFRCLLICHTICKVDVLTRVRELDLKDLHHWKLKLVVWHSVACCTALVLLVSCTNAIGCQ